LPNIGGRDFDEIIFTHCASLFYDKYKVNITTGEQQYAKSKLKLLDACQKARHILTGNKQASISVECLFEDFDFHCNIDREKIDTISEPLYNEFKVCIKALLGRLTKDVKLHSAEIIGGATRMPKLQIFITDLLKPFKIDQCSRTLNADESIARGCSLQSAFYSPTIRFGVDFKVTEQQL